ncbi:MAG TPA: methyltransferase domain-containing protein [Jatrophihabitans sp.]|nr:methyltransferase domain-containing protein [Jatrophihabitans sp.]
MTSASGPAGPASVNCGNGAGHSPLSAGDVTLRTYEAAAEDYRRERRNEIPPPLRALLERIVARVASGARCLEIGSGPGLEADFLEGLGVRVTRTDAASAFVRMMRDAGHDARRLDIRTDDLGGPWDLVLANAVLLHLSRTEFAAAVRKVHEALASDGCFALTLKEGDGEEWHTRKLGLPRHFTYWREPRLRAELDAAGWRVESLEHVAGLNDDWLYVVVRAA